MPAEPFDTDDRRSRMRAADSDRELVHQLLSAAMANGSLSPQEYEERATVAVSAKTFGDLDALTDDLPVTQLGVPIPGVVPAGEATRVSAGSSQTAVRHRIAIMSGAELKGRAVVADKLNATAVMGGVEIDLRDAVFTHPELTIECVALMGGIDITVPPDVTVDIGGLAVMGGFGRRAEGAGAPGAPTVRITGLALMGGVDVKRKERGTNKRRLYGRS